MPDPIAACGRSHSQRWRARNIAQRLGRVRGRATGEAQWPIGPRTTGRGIAPPPVGRRHQLVVVAGTRRRGTCVETSWERDGGGSRSSTGRRVWETRGLPSYAAGRSANIAGGRYSQVSLTSLLQRQCVCVLRATFVKLTTEACCRWSMTITCDTAVECRNLGGMEVGLST